ncbi:MAG TPA: hypothetical protein VJ792_02855 [Candidatus Nitrosotalea sp.]|nr:hypothetical protein [Candidatus Nitrosotalea sp.]
MASRKLVALFAVIIVSAAAGLVWPFFTNIHFQPLPSAASLWHMGKGSQYEPEMVYKVYDNNSNFTADLKFLPGQGANQSLSIEIRPEGSDKVINQTVQIGLVYDYPNVSPEAKPYFDKLDESVFSMRDYATTEQYLVKGAEWGDLYIGANHEKLTVTDAGTMPFGFGSAKAYLLSYRIGANENKFWIVDNLPLPVKAQVYDFNGTLDYDFELVSLKAPSTPGLS